MEFCLALVFVKGMKLFYVQVLALMLDYYADFVVLVFQQFQLWGVVLEFQQEAVEGLGCLQPVLLLVLVQQFLEIVCLCTILDIYVISNSNIFFMYEVVVFPHKEIINKIIILQFLTVFQTFLKPKYTIGKVLIIHSSFFSQIFLKHTRLTFLQVTVHTLMIIKVILQPWIKLNTPRTHKRSLLLFDLYKIMFSALTCTL